MKPWLEDWREEFMAIVLPGALQEYDGTGPDGTPIYHSCGDLTIGGMYSRSKHEVDNEARSAARNKLAAAAPALAQALLAVEWSAGWLCHSCGARYRHVSGCLADAALTAAGLTTARERDEAREEMQKR